MPDARRFSRRLQCSAQCVKYSYRLVGADMRLAPTELCLTRIVNLQSQRFSYCYCTIKFLRTLNGLLSFKMIKKITLN